MIDIKQPNISFQGSKLVQQYYRCMGEVDRYRFGAYTGVYKIAIGGNKWQNSVIHYQQYKYFSYYNENVSAVKIL